MKKAKLAISIVAIAAVLYVLLPTLSWATARTARRVGTISWRARGQ
jgi:hypothetical protein